MAIRCYGVMGFGDLRAKLDCLMKKYGYIFNDVYHIFKKKTVLSCQDSNRIDYCVDKYN